MELQINDLVSAIKKDGIEAANKEAESIISAAKAQAETILSTAKSEALKIKENSEKEIKTFEESARISAEQAKRDAVLAFKSQLQVETEKLLKQSINKVLDEKLLSKLILAAASGEDLSNYAVEIANVGDGLKAELAEEINNGLELRLTKSLKGGFKLSAKDGSAYIDCSDEELKDALMPFFRELYL